MSINLIQRLDVEVDSRKLLKQYLELAMPTVLNSIEEIAVKVVDHNDKYKKLYYPSALYSKDNVLPILLIGGWYKSEGKERSFFNGYKPWKLFKEKSTLNDSIDYIMSFLDDNQSELTKRFSKDCGDGYDHGFNHFDGSINTGFKLISNQTFPTSLSVSMVHIYYGK